MIRTAKHRWGPIRCEIETIERCAECGAYPLMVGKLALMTPARNGGYWAGFASSAMVDWKGWPIWWLWKKIPKRLES